MRYFKAGCWWLRWLKYTRYPLRYKENIILNDSVKRYIENLISNGCCKKIYRIFDRFSIHEKNLLIKITNF